MSESEKRKKMKKKMKSIKILDLFAGTQSVRQALNNMFADKIVYHQAHYINGSDKPILVVGYDADGEELYEYIGVDIYSDGLFNNMILDLSQENTYGKLLKRLGRWKPNVIWASPVCSKSSLATAIKGGHNAYFKVDKKSQTITPWAIGVDTSKLSGAKNYLKIVGTPQAHADAINTLKMFANTRLIVEHFGVPFAIENPRHSLTKYILKAYYANHTSYCMYGFPQQKHTMIYTNKKISLKKCNHPKGSHKVGVYGKAKAKNKELVSSYAARAAVPSLLIESILKELLNV